MVQSVPSEDRVVPEHSSTKLTYDDFVQFPDDGRQHEIIEGEHYVTPSPSARHQRILLRLSYLLQSYLEAHPLGEIFIARFDVLLSEFNVFEPDLIYLSRDRAGQLTEKNLQGAPDLVVEILSPSTRLRDQRLKRQVYERTGVQEYWLIDPDADTIDVLVRGGAEFAGPRRFMKGDVLTTELLPGLQLPLDRILRSG
jgi:Uma2 family endonuclease